MPKQRITKEMVVDAAFALVRQSGPEALTVGAIAARLGCSVQPIYSYCRNMASLRQEVAARAGEALRAHLAQSLDPADLFRSTGQAYVQFARAEPQLFRLAVLRRRQGIGSWEQLYRQEADPAMAARIAAQLGIPTEQARWLHLHMLVYTMGLGAIFSCCEPGIGEAAALAQQQAAYEAFLGAARQRAAAPGAQDAPHAQREAAAAGGAIPSPAPNTTAPSAKETPPGPGEPPAAHPSSPKKEQAE